MRHLPHLTVAALILLSATLAHAQTPTLESPDQGVALSLGPKVGGYGFRAAQGADGVTWFDCRMDGVGLMSTLELTPHLFTEVSVDFYQATSGVVASGHMDRVSLHTLGAIGVRMMPEARFSPFVQVGGGAEYTEVTFADQGEHAQWYPTAFMGLGGEVRLGDRFHLGVGLRFLAMAHPDHDHAEHDHDATGQALTAADQTPEMTFAPAAQGLGWLRYTLF